ncbi:MULTISPECIES: HAD-IA family hydrolase [unclassified Microbacterium]|uniref:HAD-IA family hydrolase n=1 Tax=unclassified Microbacterium TaxID=2609290 RepID=UPI00215868D1|nr:MULTISPECIES: HAD-IA family hydrolase [unclassified Microbacterium]
MNADQLKPALLFDMDGTLLDSTPLVEKIWGQFAYRHSCDVDAVLAFAHGRPTRATVTHFLPSGLDVDAEVEAVAAAEATETEGIRALPGAREYLNGLAADRWAVVTSATRTVATVRMTTAGLPIPEVLIASDDVVHGKPSPEGYLRAAQALRRPPAECVVFEDAGPGVTAGLRSGARVIVVGAYRSDATEGLTRIGDFFDLVGVSGIAAFSPEARIR